MWPHYHPLWTSVLLAHVKQVSSINFPLLTTWKGLYFLTSSDILTDSDILGLYHEEPEKHVNEFAFYTLMLGTLYLSKVCCCSVDTGVEKLMRGHR